MIDIIYAIKAIKADAWVTVNNSSVDGIIWHDDNPTNITNEAILAKQTELQAEHDAKQYQRDREKEYPTWQDQLDDIYHNGIDGWKATIKATKDKYPKD
jgi:hypothetical protein